MRFFQSRSFPDGFAVRSVTVRRQADGWFISVRLQDDSVPVLLSLPEVAESDRTRASLNAFRLGRAVKTAVGVDLGIAKLASLSTNETVPNPQFAKKAERQRKILHRRASRKRKGSTKRRKAYQRLARLENKVVNRRADYQWKLANKLTKQADVLVFEDLNVKGMSARCKPKQDENGKYVRNGQSAKAGLNKAILDASWGELKQKIRVMSEKAGVIFLELNPRHTSQECSECGYISPTNRDKERFLCEPCGYFADADVDAAVVIRQRGLKQLGIYLPQLPVVHGKVTPKKPVERLGSQCGLGVSPSRASGVTSVGLPAESGKPLVFQQLSLLELLESRKSG